MKILGREISTGYLVALIDGTTCYVTDCCHASAKGSMGTVVCRACYQEIDPGIGGIPPQDPVVTEGRMHKCRICKTALVPAGVHACSVCE